MVWGYRVSAHSLGISIERKDLPISEDRTAEHRKSEGVQGGWRRMKLSLNGGRGREGRGGDRRSRLRVRRGMRMRMMADGNRDRRVIEIWNRPEEGEAG
jgi:hypothetical protein